MAGWRSSMVRCQEIQRRRSPVSPSGTRLRYGPRAPSTVVKTDSALSRGTLPIRCARPTLPAAATASAGDGRVLAGELGCRSLQALLLAIEARLAVPGALEVVLDVEAEPVKAVGLDLDGIPVLEAAEPAMVRAGGEDVARLQGVDGGDPLEAAGDLVRHVARVEVLRQLAVDPEPHLEVEGIRHLVRGDDARPDRGKGVARLHLIEGVAGGGEAAGRAVDEVGVAEDVAHGFLGLEVGGALAHHHSDFGFSLEDGGGDVGQDHGVAVADHCRG